MAKWIGDAREAQRLDEEADAETIETPVAPRRTSAWKSLTLQQLFGAAEKPRSEAVGPGDDGGGGVDAGISRGRRG